MSIAFAFLVGTLLWIPTLMLVVSGVSGLGPGMGWPDQLSAWAPLVFIAIPTVVRSPSAASAWWIALAPLLIWASILATQVLHRALFNGRYVAGGDLICNLIAVAFWAAIGGWTLFHATRARRLAKTTSQ